MPLTLTNSLSSLVAYNVCEVSKKNIYLGESLATGYNQNLTLVDAFLGNSITDVTFLAKSIYKNISYGTNMLSVADEYLKSIASALQNCLNVLNAVNSVSTDKLPILEKRFFDSAKLTYGLIRSAEFDQKKLFLGDISNISIQVKELIHGNLTINIKDLGGGKWARSYATTLVNQWFAEDYRRCNYYNSQEELNKDMAKNNINIMETAARMNGHGSGGRITYQESATAIIAIRDNNPKFISVLNITLPNTLRDLKNIVPFNADRDFTNATRDQIITAMGIPAMPKQEISRLSMDKQKMAITDPLTMHIYTTALATIRVEQANIANQKQNLLSIANALRATTDIIKKASDSYLKSDYVSTAQKYAENIRKIIASITALQANNRIPETVQRLLDSMVK